MNTKKSTQKEIKDKDISKISQSRGRYNSHLTHINGWFDFGSTLGHVWTGKTLKTLVAAITLVLMVLGMGNVWGQGTRIANVNWSGVTNGHQYTLTSANCSNGIITSFMTIATKITKNGCISRHLWVVV